VKCISVGPDTCTWAANDVPKGTSLIVDWYEYGNYDGSGTAIAKAGRKYYYANLSHCSCYGPTESGFDLLGDRNDLKKFLTGGDGIPRAPKDYDYARFAAIAKHFGIPMQEVGRGRATRV